MPVVDGLGSLYVGGIIKASCGAFNRRSCGFICGHSLVNLTLDMGGLGGRSIKISRGLASGFRHVDTESISTERVPGKILSAQRRL